MQSEADQRLALEGEEGELMLWFESLEPLKVSELSGLNELINSCK